MVISSVGYVSILLWLKGDAGGEPELRPQAADCVQRLGHVVDKLMRRIG